MKIIHYVSGFLSVLILSAVTFYAWIYRNFLGLGEGPFYEVTGLEKFATVAFVVVIMVGLYSLGAVNNYTSNDQSDRMKYREHLMKELKKHGIE